MPPTISIVQTRLHHFRVPFYQILHGMLAEKGIRLVLIHGEPSVDEATRQDSGHLAWATTINNRRLSVGDIELVWQPCLHLLSSSDMVVVQQENKLLLNYILLLGRQFHRGKLAFWGHGMNCQSPNPNGMRERWKRLFTRLPDWWFAYTDFTKETLLATGVPAGRITVVNNAVDTSSLRAWLASITEEEIDSLRRCHGLSGYNAGIYCGSLYEHKRIGFLVEAAERIRAAVRDFELIIVGAGPDAGKAMEAGRRNPWIHYVGPQSGRAKAAFLKLGRVSLMPGAVGLAILDSFAAGLPLITTDCGLHGPEISYLRQGRNGLSTANSMDDYVAAVVRTLQDRQLLSSLSRCCVADGNSYTIEDMARRFAGGVVEALGTEAEHIQRGAIS